MLGFSSNSRKRILFSISTLPSSSSPSERRLLAKSRIGTIIRQFISSRYSELSIGVLSAFLVLGVWGTSEAGQIPFIGNLVRSYIEEKATSFQGNHDMMAFQVAEASAFIGTGGDVSSPDVDHGLDSQTLQDSAMVAFTPPQIDYIDQLASHRNHVTNYTVQDGDLLSFIASDFGVSVNSILWANNLKNADSISPGQVLRIPPVSGVIYQSKNGDTAAALAKKFHADEVRIIAYNELPQDGHIMADQEVIIPDGTLGSVGAAAGKSSQTGPLTVASIVARGIPITDALIKKVGRYTEAGSELTARMFSYLPDLGDYFTNPTAGFNWGILHDRNGVDEANSCGTPVQAAADGTVTVADGTGWNGGFGKYIKISHSNGTETLYGHLSKILVTVGQQVNQGQHIGNMGTTGNSTGCHLHFEVHGARNPLAKY